MLKPAANNTKLILLTAFVYSLALIVSYSNQETQYIKYSYYPGEGCNSNNQQFLSVSLEKTETCLPSKDPTYGYEIGFCNQVSSDKIHVVYKTSCNKNCTHCLTISDNVFSKNEFCGDKKPIRMDCGSFRNTDYPPMLWTVSYAIVDGEKSECKDNAVKSISGVTLGNCISNHPTESFVYSCNSTWVEKRVWENEACKDQVETIEKDRLNQCINGKVTFCGKK